MKYFLLTSFVVVFFSCKKDSSNSDRIQTIIHQAGLGDDVLHYYYDANGQVNYIKNGFLRYQFVYENNKIILRNLFENSTLLQTDSIAYNVNGDISRFIAHRFNYGTSQDERDQTDFTYQGNKLIMAQSKFAYQLGISETFAEYTWDNDNIKKIILRPSPSDSTELLFTYSSLVNPYGLMGQQVWLLDPGFDFTRYDNLQRIAYLSSRNRTVSVERYYQGNHFVPLTVNIQTNVDNKVTQFQITPTDESIEYHYEE
jgi:hypothetical protein